MQMFLQKKIVPPSAERSYTVPLFLPKSRNIYIFLSVLKNSFRGPGPGGEQ
jgi:hypothetical protein